MVISKINSNFAAQFSNCNFNIGIWCNGNTTDSGPVFPGSNPGIPTDKPLVKDKDLLKL